MKAFPRIPHKPLFLSLACALLIGLDVVIARWLYPPREETTVAEPDPSPPGRAQMPGMPPLFPFEQNKPALGEAAPDFTLHDVEGKPFRLSDYAGRVPVVIEFGSFT